MIYVYNIRMDSPKKIVIAIDGYASCGKSTMAKELARKIGYVYIDSGAMYRAVTLYCIEEGLFEGDTLQLDALRRCIDNIDISFRLNAGTGRPETYLNGRNVEREIRSMAVSCFPRCRVEDILDGIARGARAAPGR